MAPIVHLVRHAQGFHNGHDRHDIPDPLLTELGKAQCAKLEEGWPYHHVDLIVSSPIRRTIYTSLLGFDHDIKKKGLRIIALPELQEISDLPCDTGSPLEDLTKEFADHPIDWTLVTPDWHVKEGRFSNAKEAIIQRAQEAREWLKLREEKEIVVVTHGGFLHYLTEEWGPEGKYSGAGWANTEYRTYHFDTSSPETCLVETEESKRRRDFKPLDRTEKTQLRRTESREAAEQAENEARRASAIHDRLNSRRRDDIGAFV